MAKVKVNHNGLCNGHYYKKDEEVELPESVISAVGEANVERTEKAETKEAKNAQNKMMDKDDAKTK